MLRIRIRLHLLHFKKSDPLQEEKLDPDPHQSQNVDPEGRRRFQLRRGGSVPVVTDFHHFDEEQDLDPDLHQS